MGWKQTSHFEVDIIHVIFIKGEYLTVTVWLEFARRGHAKVCLLERNKAVSVTVIKVAHEVFPDHDEDNAEVTCKAEGRCEYLR